MTAVLTDSGHPAAGGISGRPARAVADHEEVDTMADEPRNEDEQITDDALQTDDELLSPEEMALAEAMEAEKADEDAKAEEAAKSEAAGEAGELPEVDDAPPQGEAPKAEGDEPHGKTAPVDAVIAERRARQEAQRAATEAAQEAAYWRGVAEGRSQQPGQQQPAPADPLVELKAARKALAQKFDNGELTATEWEEQREVIDDRLWQLRSQQATPDLNEITGRVKVDTHLETLPERFPVLNEISSAQAQALVPLAYERAQAAGQPIGSGHAGTMQLREMVAKLATEFYGKPATGTQPKTPTGLSEAAKARAAKLDVAGNQPPNVHQLGTGADGQMSESDLETKLASFETEDEVIEYLESVPGLAKKVTGMT